MLAGTLTLALSAHVQVPFHPVPMTLQTMVVLVIGATYGARLGLATVGLYLAEGLAGLPVFAGGAGPLYMAGPTGGYLAGFLAAVALMGLGAARGLDRTLAGGLGLMIVGHAVILGLGWAWLAHLVGPETAWTVGVAPFLWATLVKTAAAAALVRGLWAVVGRTRA